MAANKIKNIVDRVTGINTAPIRRNLDASLSSAVMGKGEYWIEGATVHLGSDEIIFVGRASERINAIRAVGNYAGKQEKARLIAFMELYPRG